MDYSGNDIKGTGKVVESYELCATWCRATPRCTHWTYEAKSYGQGTRCFLKTSDAGRVSSKFNLISGNRQCGIEGEADDSAKESNLTLWYS